MKSRAHRESSASRAGGAGRGADLELCREVLRTCGSFNLRRASRAVTQLYDEMLQPTGLRSTQVVVLVAVAADPEIGLARLARELVLSPSTLSRTIRPLERDGLLEARGAGGRGKTVRLTQQGRKALLDAVPYWQRAQERFTALLGGAQWEALSEQLSKTVTATRR